MPGSSQLRTAGPSRRRRGWVAASAALLTLVTVLGFAPTASALGYNNANCSPSVGGWIWGRSWQFTFSDAGGWTEVTGGCGPSVSVHLRYQPYPGGPYYNTSKNYSTYYVSKSQSGTVNGYHYAYLNGNGVGGVNT